MCFRPSDAGAAGPMKCPGCGKPIQMMAGLTLDKCPFCKEDFTPYLNGEKEAPGMGAPGAPAAPGAPKAPGAPGAPSAPKAPGA